MNVTGSLGYVNHGGREREKKKKERILRKRIFKRPCLYIGIAADWDSL